MEKRENFYEALRRESWRLGGELASIGRRKPATAGRPLARASVGFLARNLNDRSLEAFRRSPPRGLGGAAGFPTPARKISSDPESDSARGEGLPGGTTEVSSPERGLVSPQAGATERRKVRRNFRAFFFLTLLFLMAGCATRPPRVAGPVVPMRGVGGITHTLVKGETIWRLAETYDVKANTILKANRIQDPSSLKVGTQIWIPGAGRAARTLPFLPPANRWSYIIIHHSATEVGNAELFDKGHRRRGFWNGLGYHFVIDNGTAGTPDGQIETSHRWIHQMDGAHCNAMDMNQKGIGICLVGNFDNERVSDQQLTSLVWLVRQLQAKYNIPKQRVLQHHDVPGKNGTHCPGRQFPWSKFRKQLL